MVAVCWGRVVCDRAWSEFGEAGPSAARLVGVEVGNAEVAWGKAR